MADAPANPTDPRLADAAAAKAQAEALKAQADARKAAADAAAVERSAAFPTATIKPGDARLDVGDKSGYPATVVAYQALEAAAWHIAGAINDRRLPATGEPGGQAPAHLLLVDTPDLAAASFPLADLRARLPYWQAELGRWAGVWQGRQAAYTAELERAAAASAAEAHRGAFADILKELNLDTAVLDKVVDRTVAQAGAVAAASAVTAALAPAAAVVPAALALVGGAADVLSYFQSAVTLRPASVSVDDLALRASIIAKLVGVRVSLQDFAPATAGGVAQQVADLVGQRLAIEQAKERVSVTAIAAAHAAVKARQTAVDEAAKALDAAAEADRPRLTARLEAARRELARAQAKAAPLDADAAAWAALTTAFDGYIKGLAAPGADGRSPLGLAALWEQVLGQGVSHVLYAKVVSSGGEQQARQSRLPWVGQRVNYLGGVTVTYVLVAVQGADAGHVVAAGTHSALSHLEFDVDSGRPSGAAGRFDLRALANPDLG